MSTLSHGVIAVVRDIIDADAAFYRTAGILPEPLRTRVMGNRARVTQDILSLMRVVLQPPDAIQRYVVNIPLDLNAGNFEPVAVTPTQAQIASALETGVAPPENHLCPICQEEFTGICSRLNRCGHHFHAGCITQWFGSSPRCPVCRDDVREPQLQGPTGSNVSGGGHR